MNTRISAASVYEPRLGLEITRRLSRVRPGRWLCAAFCDWALIGGAIWISRVWPYWPVLLGAIVIIGTRQHALGVLVHEGVHYRIHTSRFWNDFLSDYLAGFSILTPTVGYRGFHLKHHLWLDTAEDPERITTDRFSNEWSFPLPPQRFLWLLFRDLSGLWPKPLLVLSGLIWNIPAQRAGHILKILVYHGAVTGFLAANGLVRYYFLLWWVPLFTIFPVCFRIRTAAEHSGIEGAERRFGRERVDVLSTTRTTLGGLLGRFCFAPHNVSLHVEHHLYPSVPYSSLPDLRKILWADPEFGSRCHNCRDFVEAFKELTRKNDFSPRKDHQPNRSNK